MMINELIFIAQVILMTLFTLGALHFGSQALVALISVYIILANLFVTKQITLFGFDATASDTFTIGATLALNLLQEFWGSKISNKAIWISFFCLVFYTLVSQLHLWYIPNMYDIQQGHFYAILEMMPRITIASMFVYLVVQHIDRALYGYMQKNYANHFLLRNYASLIVSQFIDTVLFSFLGLYGIVHNVFSIIMVSYAIKLVAIVCAIPFVSLVRKITIAQD